MIFASSVERKVGSRFCAPLLTDHSRKPHYNVWLYIVREATYEEFCIDCVERGGKLDQSPDYKFYYEIHVD